MPLTYDELVALFRKLGESDPESWARSETNEGIPQLTRLLVLKGLWGTVLDDTDTRWIDAHIEGSKRDAKGPLGGVGPALERLLAAGVDRQDLADVVRGLQYEMLHSISYLLANADAALTAIRAAIPELPDVDWGLWEMDTEGNPTRLLDGFHEDVLTTDPTGREMRSR